MSSLPIITVVVIFLATFTGVLSFLNAIFLFGNKNKLVSITGRQFTTQLDLYLDEIGTLCRSPNWGRISQNDRNRILEEYRSLLIYNQDLFASTRSLLGSMKYRSKAKKHYLMAQTLYETAKVECKLADPLFRDLQPIETTLDRRGGGGANLNEQLRHRRDWCQWPWRRGDNCAEPAERGSVHNLGSAEP